MTPAGALGGVRGTLRALGIVRVLLKRHDIPERT